MEHRADTSSPLTVLAFLSLALWAIAAFGQPAPAPDPSEPGEPEVEGFFEAVDVEIVNVDVWVTDESGRHVQGLTREDFQVYRDGAPVETANFYAVEDGRPAESVAKVERPRFEGDEPVIERPGMTSPLAPEHRLWLVVYVDNFNSDPLERNRSLPALRQFLGDTLRPGDQVMLVSYDRSLKVRVPFTQSVEQIFAGLDEIRGDSGMATVRDRERFDTLERIDEAEREVSAMAYAQTYADSQMIEVEETAEAMQRLIESLGGLPGRKALVYLSSGVPILAGEEAFQAVATKFTDSLAYSEIGRHDTTRKFERVARHANTHRVVFYTVDAGGLRAMQFGAAEYGEFVSPELRRMLDNMVVENLHTPLRLLAAETGGRAILNLNEILPALEEAATDMRTFYSLGISSADADQGRYHEVKVELRDRELRKKYDLRHRTGYRSRSTDLRMDDSLRSALLYGYEENPIGLAVRWGRPELQGGKDDLYVLPIQLKIPLRDLVLLPITGGKHELRLRLYVGVADERGDVSEFDHVPIGLRLDDQHVEAAKGESFLYTHKLLLGPGLRKVGLAILDLVGRESSFLSRAVQVGPVGEIDAGSLQQRQ